MESFFLPLNKGELEGVTPLPRTCPYKRGARGGDTSLPVSPYHGEKLALSYQHHVDFAGAVNTSNQCVFDVGGAARPSDEVHVRAKVVMQKLMSA